MSHHPNARTTDQLRSFIDRLERLRAEKKALDGDINDLKTEIKGFGLNPKAIEKIVKERAETASQRATREYTEEQAQIYRAALGMLDGTPLGDAARERLSRKPDEEDGAEQPATPAPAAITAEDIAGARERGQVDFAEGRKVTENPYVAGDPRRAAWDEGWCAASGSDGMDIPAAFRRPEKKKPDPKDPSDGENPGPDDGG